ncbi:DUF1254 domain-containing protein [Pseudomonas koreensis]|uniref:DUF1254 domain-containing protein n=1 Tax=Pseudomonas koreensis TaxID=198620 RepID=UPI003D168800
MWFQWFTDFGLLSPDRGEGGKYLFVPRDYKGELPEGSYLVQKMGTPRATLAWRATKDFGSSLVARIKDTLNVYRYLPSGNAPASGLPCGARRGRVRPSTRCTGRSCGLRSRCSSPKARTRS